MVTATPSRHDDVSRRPESGEPNGAAAAEVVAIFGPTASGKSALAEAVADRLGTGVVSADAMQVYRGLPILTNQPERPTRLVGIVPLTVTMSVAAYANRAQAAVDGLVAQHGCVVVSGGTGLYLRAALAELAIPPAPAEGARERWQEAYDADPAGAHELLTRLDPAAAAAVHPNDRRRVVRALELAETGASLVRGVSALWTESCRRPTALFGLDVAQEELERRIRRRTEAMFARGVREEAAAALAAGVSSTAGKALGLHEVAMLPAAEAIERIVVRSRRYAGYQRKWMRRLPGLVMLDGSRPVTELADAILEVARPR
jgi:tRNA dimethylallyltransferase